MKREEKWDEEEYKAGVISKEIPCERRVEADE